MTATDTGMRLTLRPYQEEALARIAAAEARGVRKQLGVAATGLGKTIIFCALAQQRGGRTLILAHRDELVSQAVAKVREVWPGVDVGIVKAEQNDVHAQVVVASVQTLSRTARLAKLTDAYTHESILRPVDPFGLVVVDEAHHTAADTYRRILDALRAGDRCTNCEVELKDGTGAVARRYNDPACHVCHGRVLGPLLLGVTATPDRGDGKGLDDLFDEITWTYDILWGIRSGYLADVRGYRVVLDRLDLGAVKVSRGDYEAGSAGRAMEDADAPAVIVKAWQEHAAGHRTIVFTPTVTLAAAVAAAFQHAGIRAGMVSADTPLEARRSLLRRYAIGEIDVIANCAVLTEGFDEPRTDCIVVARPTKSRALFTQMVGRGTRKHPDKTDLLVLDVVGATGQHSLVTVPSLFGLPEKFARHLGDGTQNLTDAVGAYERDQVAHGRLRAEEAELFRKAPTGALAWVPVHREGEPARYERALRRRDTDGRYRDIGTLVLVGDADHWLAGIISPTGTKRVLIADVGLELAQGVGEDYARKAMGWQAGFLDPEAKWRKKPPSPKQAAFGKRLGLSAADYPTAGAMSDAIDRVMARRKNRPKKASRT